MHRAGIGDAVTVALLALLASKFSKLGHRVFFALQTGSVRQQNVVPTGGVTSNNVLQCRCHARHRKLQQWLLDGLNEQGCCECRCHARHRCDRRGCQMI